MSVSRDDMVAALKARTIPVLRAQSFNGSFPHFYRDRGGHVDLLTFQFSQYGGRFVVEIAHALPSRENLSVHCRALPTAKLRVFHTLQRLRLGIEEHSEHWFTYDGPHTGYSEVGSPVALAQRVAEIVQLQGEDWWRARRDGS